MTDIPGWGAVSVTAVSTLIVLLLAFLSFRTKSSQKPLPPGPRGWPLLGCLAMLGKLPNQSLYELSKQYGPLMFMRLGSVKALVVTSPKLAEEVLKKYDLVMCSRPVRIAPSELFYNGSDFAFVPYGPYWRYVRKLATVGLLTANRISGFRDVREREVLAVLHFILEESQRGDAVNMTHCFHVLGMNNITQMMMSKSYSELQSSGSKSDAALPGPSTMLLQNFRELSVLLAAFNVADYVPLLKPFDPQGLHKRAKTLSRRLDEFLEQIIEEHRQKQSTATTENHKDDFIDTLLRHGHTDEFGERHPMTVCKALLLEMLSAAGDTIAATGLWALAELVRNPQVMRKAQDELNFVIGPHRMVEEEDLPKLKYLNAVMKETLRLHPAAPLMIPHLSMENVEIEGFHVPAGTQVFINLWGMHRDPMAWEQPLEFNPDRFSNSTVDYKGQHFQFIPFGSGRRMCPGVSLGALMVLYPLSVLLHAIDFTIQEGKPKELDMSETSGVVLCKALPLNVFGKSRLPNHVIYGPKEVRT